MYSENLIELQPPILLYGITVFAATGWIKVVMGEWFVQLATHFAIRLHGIFVTKHI